ncbi:MAG: PD-(D/E)XK nuclease family protein [Alphaproteobacteria bacterium]|nr:PD-(D/E)XK nuclease family protein [Alphaproteobacteria bacterium]
MVNNLFTYATSELSQDAFLAWLFSHAIEGIGDRDRELTKCAKDFLNEFLFTDDKFKGREFWLTKAPERQFNKIDLLLTIKFNDEDKEYKVIIEDKTSTSEHDNQLERYKEAIESQDSSIDKEHLLCIYYKTGLQSNLDNVKKNNYKACVGKNVYNFFCNKKYSNIKSDIFQNYCSFVEHICNQTDSWKNADIEKWDYHAKNGFFAHLKKQLNNKGYECDYAFEYNPAGGEYVLYQHSDKNNQVKTNAGLFQLYFQFVLKNNELYFDIRVTHADDKKETITKPIRESLCLDNWRKENNPFKKPVRYGKGKTITLCRYNKEIKISDGIENLSELLNDYKNEINKIRENVKNISKA